MLKLLSTRRRIKQALTVLNPLYSSEDFEKMSKYVFKIYPDCKGHFPLYLKQWHFSSLPLGINLYFSQCSHFSVAYSSVFPYRLEYVQQRGDMQ